MGGGEAEEAQARLGEFVDGGFGDPFGVARVESKEAEESAGDGAERDLGVRDGEAAGGLAGSDVTQGAGASPRGASRRSRPAPVMKAAISGWVQARRPEMRSEMANTSAGSSRPAQAASIICAQRSSTSSDAVWKSSSLLTKWL